MKKVETNNEIVAAYRQLPKDTIDDDFILVDNIKSVPLFDFPYKVEVAIATICLKGTITGTLNLKDCSFSENSFLVVLPGQIVQYSHVSEDFSALLIIMSKRFTDNLELSIKNSVSVFLHFKENPAISLKPDELDLLKDYYYMLKKIVQMKHNPHRMEIVRLLIQGFFLGASDFQQYRQADIVQKTRKELQFESFYGLVLKHYKESREVGFYADKLCLTPKYLSAIIKEVTGKSAYEWINDYVILEAKSLLKSTNTSVQEISNNLGFPNQSFFGKFFKQHTGTSPKEYRQK